MEEEILKRIDEQGKKIDEIYKSVEKTRKYFLWTMIVTIILFVLPLIVIAIILPQVMNSYMSAFNL